MYYIVARMEAAQEPYNPPVRGGNRGGAGRRSHPYFTLAMALISLATTSLGSGAYVKAATIFCPSVSIQCRNPVMAFNLTGSLICSGMSSQVKVQIGYAFFPGASVMETRKSSGISLAAPAAAAVV